MPERPIVTHVNHPDGYDIYGGRAVPRKGLKASAYANPIRIGQRVYVSEDGHAHWVEATREIALDFYREHLDEHPELVAQARRELPGKRIACWCHGPGETEPQCHLDILADVVAGEEP